MPDTRAAVPTPLAGITFRWDRMLLLGFAVFTTVTVEMVPAALVPAIAAEFDVRISTVGVLLTVWAVTIAVASLPLVRLLRRVDRRTVLVGSLVTMAAANLAVAAAPVFGVAVGARVIAAAAHGVFWSIVMVYASAIAPPQQTGRAVAIAGSGGTAAIFLGIPIGAAIGQFADWRIVFVLLAILMAGSAGVIRFTLPAVSASHVTRGSALMRRAPSLRPVLVVGFVQLLVALGHFTLYTYISPYLTTQAHIPQEAVSALLLVFGSGGLMGLVAVGITADRWPRASLITALGLLASGLLAVAVGSDSIGIVIAGLIAWGAAIGALPPLLLARTLLLASDDIRSTASAIAVVAFNLGIGIGAWLGGILIDGPGLGAAAATATVVAIAALLALCASLSSAGRTR